MFRRRCAKKKTIRIDHSRFTQIYHTRSKQNALYGTVRAFLMAPRCEFKCSFSLFVNYSNAAFFSKRSATFFSFHFCIIYEFSWAFQDGRLAQKFIIQIAYTAKLLRVIFSFRLLLFTGMAHSGCVDGRVHHFSCSISVGRPVKRLTVRVWFVSPNSVKMSASSGYRWEEMRWMLTIPFATMKQITWAKIQRQRTSDWYSIVQKPARQSRTARNTIRTAECT